MYFDWSIVYVVNVCLCWSVWPRREGCEVAAFPHSSRHRRHPFKTLTDSSKDASTSAVSDDAMVNATTDRKQLLFSRRGQRIPIDLEHTPTMHSSVPLLLSTPLSVVLVTISLTGKDCRSSESGQHVHHMT